MATNSRIKIETLSTSGGTYNINLSEPNDLYIFNGSGSLSGSWTIGTTSTPLLGDKINMFFDTSFVRGVNNITILGLALNDLSNHKFECNAIYNGSSWLVSIKPYYNLSKTVITDLIEDSSITTNKINNDAVTTAKLNNLSVTTGKLGDLSVSTNKIIDRAVTAIKLTSDLTQEIITVPVSFESGEQSRNRMIMNFNGTITGLYYCVTKSLSGTDAGNIEVAINNVAVNPASISIAASTAIDSTNFVNITSPNTFAPTNLLDVRGTKVTAGGKLLVVLLISRT